LGRKGAPFLPNIRLLPREAAGGHAIMRIAGKDQGRTGAREDRSTILLVLRTEGAPSPIPAERANGQYMERLFSDCGRALRHLRC
jgi:hypothetical protein